MPTGYTADIYDGKDIDFKDFAMQCARAFGALITVRDEDKNFEIPEKLEPNTYYKEQIEKAKNKLCLLNTKSTEEIKKDIEVEYQNNLLKKEKGVLENKNLRKRYDNMLEQVEKWKEPSQEHIKFKVFMTNQLKDSIKGDCSSYYEDLEVKKEDCNTYYNRNLEHIEEDIEYYSKQWARELKITKERNLWIKQLRDSLFNEEL